MDLNLIQSFSICHWNLNSILALHFIKLSLLKPCIAIYKFDFVCLSQTYLNAIISNDNNSLEVSIYNLFRTGHPSSTERSMIGGKLCRFVPLYHQPNQLQDDFESFASIFELNTDAVTANNPFLTVVLGDFNVKSNLLINVSSLIHLRSRRDVIIESPLRHHMRVLKLMP